MMLKEKKAPKNHRILRFFILNPFRLQKHEKPIIKEKAGIADDFWDDVTGNNEFLKIRNKFKKRRQLFVGKGNASLCLHFIFSSKMANFQLKYGNALL